MPFSLANFSIKTPGIPPDIQLASSDPLAWEERWEQVFRVAEAQGHRFVEDWAHKFAISKVMQSPENPDAVIRCTRSLRETLCELQTQVTYDAAPFLAENEVQRRWMSASPARRGEIILAGLVSACTNIPAMHDARLFCEKEMSVESHRQNGRLFLDLLEEMTVPNPTVDSPTYISNPVWDAISADQTTLSAKIALAKHLGDRNLLIGYVVNFALCSILDLAPPGIYQMKGASKPHKSKKAGVQLGQDRVRRACGEEAAKAFGKVALEMGKGIYAQEKEVYVEGKQAFQMCRKINDGTKQYPRCKRCWDTMHRQVLYCSPECQKVDWKAGHKKECGKLLQFEDLAPSTPEQQSPQIGPRLSGFKRPGALLFQVAQLKRLSPEYDYLIFLDKGQACFSFPHPPIRAAFRTCRDKAMTTGDRRAVATLGHFLLFKIGVDPDDMMEQIEVEYDFPEILCAVDEMEERRFLDFAERPPLILDAGVSPAEWKAVPSTWLDVGIVPSSRNRV
ncbi:hypothetical protein FB45DRAFT_1112779 [Roridomyces roridus]|uniref:MYND-type domain-containing protein n=1 Tax=Roridomyces roridus TaxID=1738132 RepID=A0AAD7B8K0_9AGAR|nr:hypothetical protein FB45DRAFT_1112779 [Roridomyces roridus]